MFQSENIVIHWETAEWGIGNKRDRHIPELSNWTNRAQSDLSYHTGVELHACIGTHAGRAHYLKQRSSTQYWRFYKATFGRNLKITLGVKVVCGSCLGFGGIWDMFCQCVSLAAVRSQSTVITSHLTLGLVTGISFSCFLLFSLSLTLLSFSFTLVLCTIQNCINLSSSISIKAANRMHDLNLNWI